MTAPHDDAQNAQTPARDGLPLWIPLAGLLVAMIFAVFVGVRIFPVLAALLFPPEPPLPPGDVRLIGTPENKGVGRDEWLFGTNGNACELMRYYQDRLGGCEEDPSISCATASGQGPDVVAAVPVAVCQAVQEIGTYRVSWTIRIATNYKDGPVTQFRITREVIN